MQRTLETASLLWDYRPPLEKVVPLLELLELVKRFKNDSCRYPEIKEYTSEVIETAELIFLDDKLRLSRFDCELKKGIYKITTNGITQIKKRLDSIYSDGYCFSNVSSKLEAICIPPLIELKPQIIGTKKEALTVADTTKKIGKYIGIDVEYPTEFLSPYQLSSSLSFLG